MLSKVVLLKSAQFNPIITSALNTSPGLSSNLQLRVWLHASFMDFGALREALTGSGISAHALTQQSNSGHLIQQEYTKQQSDAGGCGMHLRPLHDVLDPKMLPTIRSCQYP